MPASSDGPAAPPPQVALRDLHRDFARIGVMSFGGPAAQIALMHRLLVDNRRWLTEADYLRVLGASRESAKELKLFRLADHFTGRFQQLSDEIYEQNTALGRRRLLAGSVLSLLTTCGYYGAYVFVVWRAATGAITPGSMTFLAGAIAGASANIQSIFSTFASIADQADRKSVV